MFAHDFLSKVDNQVNAFVSFAQKNTLDLICNW